MMIILNYHRPLFSSNYGNCNLFEIHDSVLFNDCPWDGINIFLKVDNIGYLIANWVSDWVCELKSETNAVHCNNLCIYVSKCLYMNRIFFSWQTPQTEYNAGSTFQDKMMMLTPSLQTAVVTPLLMSVETDHESWPAVFYWWICRLKTT